MKESNKHHFRAILVASLIACGTLLAGCQSSAGIQGGGTAIETPEGDMQMSNFVIVNNQKIARRLQVVDIKGGYAGNLLKANVTLVSKYAKTVKYQYKFVWFDSQGMEIDPGASAWKPMVVYGFESKTLQGVAPNPSAKEFKIKLRNI